MVKQGHYAKVSKQKRLRQLKQRRQAQEKRAIMPEMVSEFLQVRYHLTQAAKQRPAMRQMMQRFMAQWLAAGQAELSDNGQTTWSVVALTKQTLQTFNRQLPWQGYALVDQEMARWTAFLNKEVPAVPLSERITLTEALSPATWQACLSEQLAINALLALTGDSRQLGQITTEQVRQLQNSIQTATGIDWEKVAQLLDSTVIAQNILSEAGLDDKTRQWLEKLQKLTPQDFNNHVE
ncbi:hypothetical protein ABC426_07635 [Lactiplantibacillus plantarum]|uniref:hypothetical protein n=1 Tax=Lactiplantibacillus plantarum TaxID=1590 RepID=UPI001BA45049|nr:hypothetical protein [Lactiplantibacillus plantarum]MBS0952918.1 hypothetical protein [Lactiplantibacillus plantarum]